MEFFCEICQKLTISSRNCKKCGETICGVCSNFKPVVKTGAPAGTLFKNRVKPVEPKRLYMAIMIEVQPDPALRKSLPATMGNEGGSQSSEWAPPGVCGKCVGKPGK